MGNAWRSSAAETRLARRCRRLRKELCRQHQEATAKNRRQKNIAASWADETWLLGPLRRGVDVREASDKNWAQELVVHQPSAVPVSRAGARRSRETTRVSRTGEGCVVEVRWKE